jgi:hypothetical protein
MIHCRFRTFFLLPARIAYISTGRFGAPLGNARYKRKKYMNLVLSYFY